MLVYWELTRSCDLACKHCRASAQHYRHPLELTKDEGYKLLEEIKAFGEPLPHVVVTGGDPLNHPDLYDILKRAQELGIGVSLSPAGTPNLTPEAFKKLKAAGIQTVSLSLDGAYPQTHDEFRGENGCFDATIKAAEYARQAGIPIQINTLVSENTVVELPEIYERIKKLSIIRWSVFFLISVGRGTALQEIAPEHADDVMKWLVQLQKWAPFAIKTTEAPQYRRVMIQEMKESGVKAPISSLPVSHGFGIRDGNGILFISHTGDVYPSGFLPLRAGNIRTRPITEIYRQSDVFRQVRDPQYFIGKCGDCEFRYICGGSRSRAFAFTGDALESDPLCPYIPHHRKSIVPEELAA